MMESQPLDSTEKIYFKGLNGIRAIGTIWVIIVHGLDWFKIKSMHSGEYVLSAFFVVSGFLISYLLLKEKSIYSAIDVKKFYMRRILRLWPIYYLLMLVALPAMLILRRPFPMDMLPFYIFYTANIPFILYKKIHVIAHYWSLAAEEQFYAMWPWIVKYSKNIFISCFILLFALLGVKFYFSFIDFSESALRILHYTRFQDMFWGCLLALLYFKKHKITKWIQNPILQLMAWIVFFISLFYHAKWLQAWDTEAICVITCVLVIGQISESSPIKLYHKVFEFIGKISYGMYIYHLFILYLVRRFLKNTFIDKYILILLTIVLSIAVAWFSYTYIEHYFLRKKKSYLRVQSKASEDEI